MQDHSKGRIDLSFVSIIYVAYVASVSVGLSAGLKHFSLLERAKIGASAKKYEKGEGKGGKFPFLGSPPPYRCFHQCCPRPNFCDAKKRKTPRTGGKNPTETLATQARIYAKFSTENSRILKQDCRHEIVGGCL